MEIDMTKDLRTITDIHELNAYLKRLFNEISKYHPKYPMFGYAWDGEKVVECKRY